MSDNADVVEVNGEVVIIVEGDPEVSTLASIDEPINVIESTEIGPPGPKGDAGTSYELEDDLVFNEDAEESGDDWKYTLKRPSSGMTENVELILPVQDGSPNQMLFTDGDGQLFFGSLTPGIPEYTKAATDNLLASQLYGSIINNYGQVANVTLTLPAIAQGMNFTVIIGTTAYGCFFRIDPNGNDAIYLDGVPSANGKYVGLITATIGSVIQFVAFRTGSTTYDWFASSVSGLWIIEG